MGGRRTDGRLRCMVRFIRTIGAILAAYIILCGILGDYEPERHTGAVGQATQTEQMENIEPESEHGMPGEDGEGTAMSPITGER